MINPLDLTGRTFLVTGASSGIGLAAAVLLSQLGARVVLMARSTGRLQNALMLLEGEGHRTLSFDLTLPDAVPSTLKSLSVEIGPLSGIVHCAGAQLLRPLRVVTTQDIDSLLKLNVVAALMLSKGLRQKGVHASASSIVFVSSVMGLVGAPGRAAYCASKSALHSMTKALAVELAHEGIRVNCIAPGFVRTPMLDEAEAAVGSEQLRRIEELQPLGIGDPRDVANAIAFLLADASRWITGSTIVVDGGYTAQ
jgi:NAD(P)-dependent dehydrogenase (short-subunit alcohol dehydrogenase family)